MSVDNVSAALHLKPELDLLSMKSRLRGALRGAASPTPLPALTKVRRAVRHRVKALVWFFVLSGLSRHDPSSYL